MDWVPTDLIADILVELTLAREESITGAKVYHPVNPILVKWKSLLPKIVEAAATDQESKNLRAPLPLVLWIEHSKRSSRFTRIFQGSV